MKDNMFFSIRKKAHLCYFGRDCRRLKVTWFCNPYAVPPKTQLGHQLSLAATSTAPSKAESKGRKSALKEHRSKGPPVNYQFYNITGAFARESSNEKKVWSRRTNCQMDKFNIRPQRTYVLLWRSEPALPESWMAKFGFSCSRFQVRIM